MKIEKLRNKKSYKWFLCGLILVVILTISYRVSKANYRISNSIELTTGKVVSSLYDFNIVSMYIDGVEHSKDTIIPDNGYAINEEQSYCYKDSKNNKDNNAKLFTDSLGNHVFKGISKGSKCIIYFDKTKTMGELLNNYYTDKRIRTSENKDFNVPYEATTTKTIFSAPDDDGTSYYFAGNPTDNWIEFGGYYWRIIRINSNGSIRMIYQGRTEDENGNRLEPQKTGEETQIGVSVFNKKADDNAYVGYWYNEGILRGLDKPSDIYTQLNNWFSSSNIKQGSVYFDKIDLNAGFCGDRTPSTDNTLSNDSIGIGIEIIWYGAQIRIRPGDTNVTLNTKEVNPTFKCNNKDDMYTFIETNKGNKKLANPIGMITADEVAYAGMVANYNDNSSWTTSNYMYTNQNYWTISPCIFSIYGGGAGVIYINSAGHLIGGGAPVANVYGLRPVINIRSDVEFTGNGTQSNPYKVVS